MARARAEGGNSVFDVRDLEDLQDIEEDCEGEVGEREVVLLAIRSITVVLVVLGSVLLTFKVWKRRRGSWKEAAAAVSIQIIWQVLAWYHLHIDQHWVCSLTRGTPDHETTRKIFQFIENLFHGLAVYSGLVVVGRLGAVVGALLYILGGMAVLIPVLFSIIILLLDIYLNAATRLGTDAITPQAVATGKMLLMDLVPLGLLVAWGVGQCRAGGHGRKGTREVASTVIAVMLLLWHLTSVAQWVVYIIIRNVDDIETKIGLTDYDRGLVEAAHLLACLAIPWAWLLGLSLPTAMGATRSSMDELDLNLKTARQNQTRNVLNLKYKKENGDHPMATPPTSPQKFSPSVTSSPSVLSASSLVKTQPLPPHLTPTTPAKNSSNTKDNALTPKRRSYMEAVSNSQLNMNPMEEEEPVSKVTPRRSYMTAVSNSEINLLEDAPPRHAKSADPLWLPSSKPIQL